MDIALSFGLSIQEIFVFFLELSAFLSGLIHTKDAAAGFHAGGGVFRSHILF